MLGRFIGGGATSPTLSQSAGGSSLRGCSSTDFGAAAAGLFVAGTAAATAICGALSTSGTRAVKGFGSANANPGAATNVDALSPSDAPDAAAGLIVVCTRGSPLPSMFELSLGCCVGGEPADSTCSPDRYGAARANPMPSAG